MEVRDQGGIVSKKGKVIQMPGGARQNQPKVVQIPSKEEVAATAREATRENIMMVAEALGSKIATLYTEEVKTAVILNTLAELLIEKGIISKTDLQARVTKNEKVMQATYRQKAAEMTKAAKGNDGRPQPDSAGEPPGPVAQTVCESGGREPEPKAPGGEPNPGDRPS